MSRRSPIKGPLPLIASLLLSLFGCGDHIYVSQRYNQVRSKDHKKSDDRVGKARVYMGIEPNHDQKRGLTRWEDTIGAPYTFYMRVISPDRASGQVELLEAHATHEGERIAIHSKDAPPKKADLKPREHDPGVDGRATIALGDRLQFKKGSEIKLEVLLRSPQDKEPIRRELTLRGEESKSDGSILNTLLHAQ